MGTITTTPHHHHHLSHPLSHHHHHHISGTLANFLSVKCRFGPLNAQDQVVIPIAIESSNGLCSVLLAVVVDKCKSFALTCHLVLCQENSGDVTEGFEQFLEVGLLDVLREPM